MRWSSVWLLAVFAAAGNLANAQEGWIHAATPGPHANSDHAMAFDPARGQVLFFGGLGSGVGTHNETWAWDGVTWTMVANTGPSPRWGAAMAADTARGRVVLFGGVNGAGDTVFGDTWEWDGTAWTLRANSGPPARLAHAMAYDPARGRIVLFGGETWFGFPFGDTWEWDGTVWTQRSASGPAGRYDHAMAYDAVRGEVVLFGGHWGHPPYGDTWGWNGVSWTLRSTSGPAGRSGHAMAADTARSRVVLFGGAAGVPYPDTWEWDGFSWTLLAASEPARRTGHAMAYDAARDRVVMFGGINGSLFDDTWEFMGCAGSEQRGYGTRLFAPICTTYAGDLTEDVYSQRSIRVMKGANDRFFLSSQGKKFSPLAVDDAIHVNGADSGLGPYSFQPGVPPYSYDASIASNLVALPAREVTGLIPSGASSVLFELRDTDRAIYGNTPVYLVRDCGIRLDKSSAGQTRLNWVSYQVDVAGMQSNLDVVSGKVSELRADQDFSRACFLGTFPHTTQVADQRPFLPAGDAYYYLVNGTCAAPIGYGNSSQGPRQGLPPGSACP